MYLVGETKDLNIARQIQKKLLKQRINCEIDAKPGDGIYFILIENKNDLETAFEIYRVYLGLPNPKAHEMPPEWQQIQSLPMGYVTKSLIILSLVVTLFGYLKGTSGITNLLKFSILDNNLLSEIYNGQIWRLWTPIFIHYGFMHIIFNMMWLKDLGKILENYKSSYHLVLFVLIVAPLSNMAQYLFIGPHFGGMSGVLYGLLGMVWMIKIFHPSWSYALPKSDLVLMIAWFFLCAIGVIPNVANLAHAGGLSLGMLYGIYLGVKEQKASFYSLKVGIYFTLSILFTVATIFLEIIKMTPRI